MDSIWLIKKNGESKLSKLLMLPMKATIKLWMPYIDFIPKEVRSKTICTSNTGHGSIKIQENGLKLSINNMSMNQKFLSYTRSLKQNKVLPQDQSQFMYLPQEWQPSLPIVQKAMIDHMEHQITVQKYKQKENDKCNKRNERINKIGEETTKIDEEINKIDEKRNKIDEERNKEGVSNKKDREDNGNRDKDKLMLRGDKCKDKLLKGRGSTENSKDSTRRT